ncbi:hypothetical protein F511_27109 [Dorcoceras hygrometricum]|uniref:Uncharacterized protein n=1 Tax=Dorcoceras hygrometricum TaxID=472368 RepID=A0A2Z7D3I9_9LAMI|nr:hypothetical protein F511_27109 [Dorcoceras hygrometricum]
MGLPSNTRDVTIDFQDVCIVIGSLATLDLPMVVDLIRIYVLKGPYCTLTTTNWFLQALSVIPKGSWGDVARRFTMIRWASPKLRFRSHNGFVGKSSRKHFTTNDWTTSCKYIQTQSTVHPDESYNRPAVDMHPVASTSRSTSGQPVAAMKRKNRCEVNCKGAKTRRRKETAVARSVVTKKRQQLSEQLLNNLLEDNQPLQAFNAQDGKNQWLK